MQWIQTSTLLRVIQKYKDIKIQIHYASTKISKYKYKDYDTNTKLTWYKGKQWIIRRIGIAHFYWVSDFQNLQWCLAIVYNCSLFLFPHLNKQTERMKTQTNIQMDTHLIRPCSSCKKSKIPTSDPVWWLS